MVDRKKLKSILKAMEGINYPDWNKLKFCIDQCFQREISEQNKEIRLAEDKIIDEYKRYSSTI